MGWADNYISKLKNGEEVSFRPRGNSMSGRISSGQLVTLRPMLNISPVKGDVVLCKVRGRQFLHLVNAIRGDQCQIANNHGHVNGWTKYDNIYGILIKVE